MQKAILAKKKKKKRQDDPDLRMTGGRDEIKESVYPIVVEAGITLDPWLFRENIVVLSFEIIDNFLEPDTKSQVYISRDQGESEKHERVLVIDIVSKSRGVNDGEGDTNAILLKF